MVLEIVLIPFAIGLSCLVNVLVERSTLRRREKGKYTEEVEKKKGQFHTEYE